jgi:CubicO group peptidase (beta-lactamase class C family)
MKIGINPFFIFIAAVLISISSCTAPTREALDTQPTVLPTKAPTARPGLDETQITSLETAVKEKYPNVLSILVQKNGVLVYEKYEHGQTQDSANPVFSVTKSVTSALVGIAMQEGYIKSLDQKIAEFLPEYFVNQADPKKKEISLRNALTMTGGLEAADNDIDRWMQSADWFKYALDLPLENAPGEKFSYNTALTHLLSGVLTRGTGMSTRDFADRYLFGPLEIKHYLWNSDPRGFYGGGHLLYLTARDMVKFGTLYLQHGKWQGQQVVPEKWTADSTQKQVGVNSNENYGYLWWLFELKDSDKNKKYTAFAARGYGGQHIIVVPELDLVVVIVSNYMQHSKDGSDPSGLVSEYILPAVR